ncbi:MAG: hypothetical protein KF747_15445 [Nitrospira sp.]|nr:hypothetical protein [Nitrospira sp.]
MLIESTVPLRVRMPTREVRLRPGEAVRFSESEGKKLLARVPDKVRCVTPEPPLQAGWLVCYRDQQDRLRGGYEEREAGTVAACEWSDSGRWIVIVLNGDRLPLWRIISVAKTDTQGRILGAWRVKEHGFDGERGTS